MSEHNIARELSIIREGVARIDERTKSIDTRLNKQNGRLDNYGKAIDNLQIEQSAMSTRVKIIWRILAGIGALGAAVIGVIADKVF